MACASPIIYLVSSSGDRLYSVSGSLLTLHPILYAEMPYSVMPRITAPIIYQAVSSIPGAPQNVLSRNVGDGSMEVQWEEPVSGVVDHYDVLLSTVSGGPFRKINAYPVTGKKYTVPNIPFGYTVYSKVRAVDREGSEGPLSDLADDALASYATTKLEFVGPVGDVMIADSAFAAILNNTIVAMRLDSGAAITG